MGSISWKYSMLQRFGNEEIKSGSFFLFEKGGRGYFILKTTSPSAEFEFFFPKVWTPKFIQCPTHPPSETSKKNVKWYSLNSVSDEGLVGRSIIFIFTAFSFRYGAERSKHPRIDIPEKGCVKSQIRMQKCLCSEMLTSDYLSRLKASCSHNNINRQKLWNC